MAPVLSKDWLIYRIGFFTKKDTWREYIGSTSCADLRRVFHKINPPAWVKCRKPGCDPTWTVLERNAQTKHMAKASEAFHAARCIAAKPKTSRGGPWVKPSLDPDDIAEARLVSKMTLGGLLGYAAKTKGLLHKHMNDLRYGRAPDAPDAAPVARGIFVMNAKRKRSGGKSTCNGNQSRKRQIADGRLKKGSKKHKILHRGKEPVARRMVETVTRPPRA